MNNEQESDKQEHERMAKKRILEGVIPLSDSLYIPKRKGLSYVLLNNATKLLEKKPKYVRQYDNTVSFNLKYQDIDLQRHLFFFLQVEFATVIIVSNVDMSFKNK
ncbi:hypothetical protein K501DRAFT_184029 [Backusella circina FSU 941]|nr:hypothetical protein K501DRAFT_184029 [Backusella circina FSU 941]